MAGDVRLAGAVDRKLLGLRLARDVELLAPNGTAAAGKPLGTARTGALVRVVAVQGPDVIVEAVGTVPVRGRVPADALTADPRELLLHGEWTAGPRRRSRCGWRARLARRRWPRSPRAPRSSTWRSSGKTAGRRSCAFAPTDPSRFEGWIDARDVANRRPDERPEQPATPVKPTHEILVETPLFAAAGSPRRIGSLMGGVLVEASQVPAGPGGEWVKVLTRGAVGVEGWVLRSSLRPLDKSVWERP